MSLLEFERTPNPDALRIVPGGILLHGKPRHFLKEEEAEHPLAARLLAVDGIVRVLIGRDFVTVIRDGNGRSWPELRPDVAFAIMDFLDAAANGGVSEQPAETQAEAGLLSDIELQIEEVLERWVRPLLGRDGGEAVLVRFDPADGTAWIRLDGACGGCPSASLTLKRGIEQTVRRWVPEVARVQAVAAEPAAKGDSKARFRDWIAAKWGGGKGLDPRSGV